MAIFYYPDESQVAGHPAGHRTDRRPREDAGPGTTRTRFGPRFTDHYYQCANTECKFWCIKEETRTKHNKKAGHHAARVETDAYTNLPSRSK